MLGDQMKKSLVFFPIAGLLLVALAVAQVSEDIIVSVDVQPYYSVVFNYASVSFGAVYPGTDIPAPGNAQGEYNATVETNIALLVSVSRTVWLPEDILTLKFASSFFDIPTEPTRIIGTTPIGVDSIAPGSYTHYHAYWLDVPIGASPGGYSTTVTITYHPA